MMQALAAADFEKSMTSYADHRVWQDVYRPKAAGIELYVKVTFDAQQGVNAGWIPGQHGGVKAGQ
jgi:motility quorum-sensing regulator/GCU-specific mRNA interferase toxin